MVSKTKKGKRRYKAILSARVMQEGQREKLALRKQMQFPRSEGKIKIEGTLECYPSAPYKQALKKHLIFPNSDSTGSSNLYSGIIKERYL